jgi:hypothetical protein
MSGIIGKPDSQSFDVNVTTSPAAINSDSLQRASVTLLADTNNTDVIKIGNNSGQVFPLVPGAALVKQNIQLNLIWVVAVSGNQILHVDCGGSVV